MRNNRILYILVSISILLNIILFYTVLNSNETHKIYDNGIEKIVELRISNSNQIYSYATGVFISTNKIITNKHAVFNGTIQFNLIEYRFAHSDDYIQIDKIDYIFEDNDLVILNASESSLKWFKIGEPQLGETVYSFGNTNGYGIQFSTGVISSFSLIQYEGMSVNMIGSSILIDGGMSGGALVNKRGLLIGILTLRTRDSNNNPIYSVSYSINLSGMNFNEML